MCGRFFVEGDSENERLSQIIAEAERRLRAILGEGTVATGEVTPTSVVAALAVGKNGEIGAFPMQWGYHLSPGNRLLINTRSETALDKPLFRPSMLERRCLIPCNWYFEWEVRDAQENMLEHMPSLQVHADEKPVKAKMNHPTRIKYAIRPRTTGLIYLAGIYRYEEGQKLPVFSVLTRAPAREISFIHDRMPVIFSEETKDAWLNRNADPKQLLQLCEKNMVFKPE